jgi:three-Cys-motif partner protein
MTAQDKFGGEWTQDKLSRLKGYLDAYMTILKKYPSLSPVYVDAFAGTGNLRGAVTQASPIMNPDAPALADLRGLLKGSARIALEVSPPFSKYIFVERSKRKCRELAQLKSEFPHLDNRIQVEQSDAAEFLTKWCEQTDWSRTRGVVFLDPFGMQVEWKLLEKIAQTQAVDLWLLVPIGVGVNRLLTQDGLPPIEWADRLTKFFGNDEWQSRFYRDRVQRDLFDESGPLQKDVSHDQLVDYFVKRLGEIFPGVANNPLVQKNSRNSPMFVLCFATANPKDSTIKAALRIAQHLLKER